MLKKNNNINKKKSKTEIVINNCNMNWATHKLHTYKSINLMRCYKP